MKCEGEAGTEAGDEGEARELPGCGKGALAFTSTLSAFPSGEEHGEFLSWCDQVELLSI